MGSDLQQSSWRRWRRTAGRRAGTLLARWPFSTAPLRRLAGLAGQRFTRRVALLVAAAILVAFLWPWRSGERHRGILEAIRMVESGGRDDCPDGDGGLAIGPYQIHRVYWRDAVAHDPLLGPERGHDYQDCRRRDYAERVIEAYMRRWVPDAWRAGEAEVIARTHNGGPTGATSPRTQRYWERVKARLAAPPR